MSGSKPRHTFERFLKEEELADRMLKVADSTLTTSTAKVANVTPSYRAATKDGKGKAEDGWEVVETPGDSGAKAAEESWVDVGSMERIENQERRATSAQQTKKT